MSQTQQRTIFGDELNELVSIETTGRVIRPFKRMLDQVASEYKVQFTSEGLVVEVVDSSNVVAIQNEIPASAFESYTVHSDTVLGLSSNGFGSALKHARYAKKTDDSVSITADQRQLETEVNREIGGARATVNERAELIDPDSIRQTPEIPELDLDVTAEMDPKAFIETVKLLDTGSQEHIKLGTDTESIVFNQDQDIQKRNIALDVSPSDVCEFTFFTASYLGDIANALRVGYVDNLTLRWSEEMPLFAEFEREDTYSGRIMIAPRIKSQ